MIKSRFTAKITSKGQITLPRAMRERLGLRQGDTLAFVEDEEGIHVEKELADSPFRKWRGYLSHIEETPDEIFAELRGPDPVDEIEGAATER